LYLALVGHRRTTRSRASLPRSWTIPAYVGAPWGRPRRPACPGPGRVGPLGGVAGRCNTRSARYAVKLVARWPSSGLDPHEDVAGAPSPAERNNRMRHCRRTKTTINPRYSRVRTRCTLQIGRTCPETLSEAGWNSTNIVPGRIGRGGPQLAQRPHKRARRGEPTRSRDPSGSICQRYV